MKRNPDIILSILEEIVESEFAHLDAKLALVQGPLKNGIETENGMRNQVRAEHIRWLIDDGLLTELGGPYVRITSAGCQFYEEAKMPGVWAKAKALSAEQGTTMAFDLFRDVVKAFARKQLKKYTELEL